MCILSRGLQLGNEMSESPGKCSCVDQDPAQSSFLKSKEKMHTVNECLAKHMGHWLTPTATTVRIGAGAAATARSRMSTTSLLLFDLALAPQCCSLRRTLPAKESEKAILNLGFLTGAFTLGYAADRWVPM
ncbi:hypothetical protein P7K49_008907 [Saguinus oedipus]|uniref:Uncharacterized protein n=1 Tax=Saguinus oedipus TaxID=9490 RepID=A0ABQ9VZ37_SAGOE|nr:hypothetical protein P7K49_008907 [Saguinus oedipus]